MTTVKAVIKRCTQRGLLSDIIEKEAMKLLHEEGHRQAAGTPMIVQYQADPLEKKLMLHATVGQMLLKLSLSSFYHSNQ